METKKVTRKVWYESDDSRLKRLLRAGTPREEIARQLNRTLQATQDRTHFLAKKDKTLAHLIRSRRFSSEELQLLRSLHSAGASCTEIASRLGRRYSSTYKKVLEEGLTPILSRKVSSQLSSQFGPTGENKNKEHSIRIQTSVRVSIMNRLTRIIRRTPGLTIRRLIENSLSATIAEYEAEHGPTPEPEIFTPATPPPAESPLAQLSAEQLNALYEAIKNLKDKE